MSLSIVQKFQILLVRAVILFIWGLEGVSGFGFRVPIYPIGYALSIAAVNVFLMFVVTAYSTNYFHWVSQGLFFDTHYSSDFRLNFNNRDVLGAASLAQNFPVMVNDIKFPEITADAVLIVDKGTERVLYEHNSSKRLASASTTKLMTALVATEIYHPEDTISISPECASIDSTKAGLPVGSEYKMKDLMSVMLISSAGDAACALAESKVNTGEFLYKMNQKAYQLGMSSTFFTNAIGLDGYNSAHFSDATDLYKLSSAAMENKTIAGIVRTKDYIIKSVDESYIGTIQTTNQLLYEIPQTVGIKTGTTAEAGQVLIYEYRDEYKDVVIIVMGSNDRFSDTRVLLNWLFASYSWNG
ncbi:hypothetical protein A2415_00870 [candidate division WWE3 bacterium RIFOXYC1_FULL_39_7]|uniref:Peptidase S11 D-alanyl-D-alanine carboxypeptidase A N-terminal domain-containing protein n=2 Tax=Katanobacteria TaxID=422282 RepID=A0A1F4X715_UNCKA|nr:MAG: hypothetical protein A2415_00870 [candidate division WWE3 bacterium RIFOXYC1_FULL_39_7]OGC77456.1 MAG: hypothetical protein A2619_03860 [candidate division WWE3 bacterium RIFOXYD1_FULL_39_9]